MATKKRAEKKSTDSYLHLNYTPKSYMSLLYGVLTVIVLFILIFLGLRIFGQKQKGVVSDSAIKTMNEERGFRTHIVGDGDSLWTISEKYYGDGFQWSDIAKSNKIINPDVIEKGQKLALPTIAKKIVQSQNGSVETQNKIVGGSYTVQEGDNLWNIAVRAYADGYKWSDIAKVNNLSNPDIIHSGNVLKLPR